MKCKEYIAFFFFIRVALIFKAAMRRKEKRLALSHSESTSLTLLLESFSLLSSLPSFCQGYRIIRIGNDRLDFSLCFFAAASRSLQSTYI